MRLDQFMVEAGLSRSRSQAREAILRGTVTVDGRTATRPGQKVGPDANVATTGPAFVSRSAHKLVAALDAFGIDPAGAHALDVGASTGGFTEVLLARGADSVIALDVGHGQLAPAIAADPRVTVMEGVNARHLGDGDLPFVPDLVVTDVSFISLSLVLPPVLALAAPASRLVALVKPQFEVGREAIGKGGLVRDAEAAREAVTRIAGVIAAAGFAVTDPIASPIEGGDGNREYLLAATRTGTGETAA